MDDTGGTIEDYTKLNKDYSKFNPEAGFKCIFVGLPQALIEKYSQ